MKALIFTIIAFFAMVGVHFFLWGQLQTEDRAILEKYYIFHALIFLAVIGLIRVFHYLVPEYTGFVVLEIFFLVFSLMFIIRAKFKLENVEYFRYHFIAPILVSLVIVTAYSIQLLKTDKKHNS